MKTNAILRIIIWSLVIVLLVGIMGTVIFGRGLRLHRSEAAVEATEVPVPLEEVPAEQAVYNAVTTDELNIRTAPSADSTAVGMLEAGEAITISRRETVSGADWAYITAPTGGWVLMEYVQLVPADDEEEVIRPTGYSEPTLGISATVTATALNIRPAPASYESSGVLEQGTVVTIGRQETINGEEWTFITAPEQGWIKTEYIETSVADAANTEFDSDISLDAKQIREIDIEWAAGNITVQPAEVDTIEVSESEPSDPKYAMVWKQNNDKLTIRFSENTTLDLNLSLNNTVSKDLTILVPMGWECDSLEVDAASAALVVKDLVIREVDFDGASGLCTFENCAISELDLDTASGDIYFTGSLDVLDCDAASASVIAVFDNAPERISMDSMSGDLDITLHSGVGFTVTMDGLSTDFTSDFGFSQNRDGSYYRGNGECRITMDAMSGDVYIREYKTAAAAPEVPAAPEAPTAPDAPTAP